MSAISAPNFSPAGGVDNVDARAAQADIRATLEREARVCIEYLEDKVSGPQYRDGRAYRIARVKCSLCTTTCEVHQVRDVASGAWPNERPQLTLFGWQFVAHEDGERAFCGKTCARRYEVKMRDHGNKALPPVERINDASYARRMYQDPPKAAAPAAQETTPARPPQTTQPAGPQPKRR